MATVKVHQDIYRFEKRRSGFTQRQIVCFVLAALAAVGLTWFLWVGLVLPFQLATSVAIIVALAFVIAAFLPVFGMPAEQALLCLVDNRYSAQAMTACQERARIEREEVSREFAKASRQPGFEYDRV